MRFVYLFDMRGLKRKETWLTLLQPGGMYELFEHVPNTLFFAKDRSFRLMSGNRAFVERCGYATEEDLIGRTDEEIFPSDLAEKYREDDLKVISDGKPLVGVVELFPNRLGALEWFITDKVPLLAKDGQVAGLCGTVRSYEGAREELQPYLDLVPVTDYLKQNFAEKVSIAALAKQAGISVRQLERRFQETFRMNPRQYVMKLRILAACELLVKSDRPITDIAQHVGFYDHSAFSRKFSDLMGMPPRDYRKLSDSPTHQGKGKL